MGSDIKELCKSLMEPNNIGSVLITSQDRDFGPDMEYIKVPKLTIEESLTILRLTQYYGPDDKAALSMVAAELDGIPLALLLARDFMLRTKKSPVEYLEEFKDEMSKISD